MPESRPSRAMTIILPMMITGDVAAVTAEGEDDHHHTGVDYNKRADTKEGHGVAEIGQDIFDKLEQILEQEVNDAVGLPVRMLVYNADRYLFDIEQHGADAHDAEQHAVRENLRTVHERYAERNAREIEQYADESVVAEYRFAYLLCLRQDITFRSIAVTTRTTPMPIATIRTVFIESITLSGFDAMPSA